MASKDVLPVDLETLARERELYENPLTEKQRDILRAAERLFSDAGYAETSTASIAKEAGVTEKTLFKHFPTKRDLFRRILFPVLLHTFVPLQIKMVKKTLHGRYASFRDLMQAFTLERWSMVRMLGPRLRMVAAEMIQNDHLRGEFKKLFQTHVWTELVQTIERHQQTGEIRNDVSAEDIARLQICMVAGHAALRGIISPEVERDDAKDARVLATLFLEGIAARGPRGDGSPS